MMLCITLPVVSATYAKSYHITQFAEMSIQLRKEINVGCVDTICGIDISSIYIVIYWCPIKIDFFVFLLVTY